MDPKKLTFDLSRRYVMDRQDTLPPEVFNLITGRLRERDIDFLAGCSLQFPPHVVTGEAYETLLQVEAFFKKNASFSDANRCSPAALNTFHRGERICRITNKRLDYYFAHRERLAPDMCIWLSKMERDIDRILGPYVSFLEQLPSLTRVTTGATSSRSKREAHKHLRISKRPVCTPKSARYLRALAHHWGYGKLVPKLTYANRVELVPKNWKTSRTIACEPEGNVFLQLAFDTFVKKRLRRVGIDLSDQGRNQELSRIGSLDGSLATIDLSMASDTLSYNAVAWMLPHPWFQFVDDVRSPCGTGRYQGRYAKFSSMGNGTTFPLETLVFTAACRAVGSRRYSVYGDDIIIETELVDDLRALLAFLGFIVNTEKSHTSGPFRESCGANWYEGRDVTPFYVRDIDGRKAVMCHLINGLVSVGKPLGLLWDKLAELCYELNLPLAPFNDDSLSGVFVHPSTAYSEGLIRRHRNWQCPQFKSYTLVSKEGTVRDSRSLFLWHLDAGRRSSRVSHLVRSRYTISGHKYRRKWVRWVFPVAGAAQTSRLFWWSEQLLLRRKPE